jgi:hypothetical protein
MRLNRLSQGLLILAVVLGGCWFAYQLLQNLGQSRSEAPVAAANSAFNLRLEADRAYNGQDWDRAIGLLDQVLERDPYDGEAVAQRAFSKWRLANQLFGDSESRSSSGPEFTERKSRSQQLLQSALDDLILAQDFPRNRVRERMALIELSMQLNKPDLAYQHLQGFVADRLTTEVGIANNPSLAPLRNRNGFSELIREESENFRRAPRGARPQLFAPPK